MRKSAATNPASPLLYAISPSGRRLWTFPRIDQRYNDEASHRLVWHPYALLKYWSLNWNTMLTFSFAGSISGGAGKRTKLFHWIEVIYVFLIRLIGSLICVYSFYDALFTCTLQIKINCCLAWLSAMSGYTFKNLLTLLVFKKYCPPSTNLNMFLCFPCNCICHHLPVCVLHSVPPFRYFKELAYHPIDADYQIAVDSKIEDSDHLLPNNKLRKTFTVDYSFQ